MKPNRFSLKTILDLEGEPVLFEIAFESATGTSDAAMHETGRRFAAAFQAIAYDADGEMLESFLRTLKERFDNRDRSQPCESISLRFPLDLGEEPPDE